MELKTGKFIVRVFVSLLVFGFGVTIFFTTDDPNMRTVGVGLTTTVFGTWMSSGSTSINAALKNKKPVALTEVVVDNTDTSNVSTFLKSLDAKNKNNSNHSNIG